jgi:hypothetical protein
MIHPSEGDAIPPLPPRPSDQSLLHGLMALFLGLAIVLAACGALFGGSNAFVGTVVAISAVISFGLLVTTLGVYGLVRLLHRNTL